MIFQTEIVIMGCRVWIEPTTAKPDQAQYEAQEAAECVRRTFADRFGLPGIKYMDNVPARVS